MKIDIQKPKQCERTIEVTLPAEAVKKEIENREKQYMKTISLDGFRKGKAPLALIRAKYGESIKGEALDSTVRQAYIDALRETKMQPITKAQIDILNFDDKELKFRASFEVMPDIDIRDYKGIIVELPPTSAKKEEIEAELNRLREELAFYEPVAIRSAKIGDYLILSGEVVKEEKGILQPQKIDSLTIVLGREDFPKELTNGLIGARIGERRKIGVRYPLDWRDEELKGKYEEYNVVVNEIKERKLPLLNDEFAKDIGFNTIQDLKENIKKRIEDYKEKARESALRISIITQIIDKNPFEVPETLKRAYIQDAFEEFKEQKLTENDKKEIEKIGIWRAKQRIILDKIASYENIKVDDVEVKEILKNDEESQKKGVDKVFEELKQSGNLSAMKEFYKREKTLDFLVKNSIVREKQ